MTIHYPEISIGLDMNLMFLSTEQALLKTMQTSKGRENAYLCYYEWDVSNAYHRFIASEEWLAVLNLLSKYNPPIRSALDLGAGNGIASYALEKSGYSVTSLEPDPSELVGYGAMKKFKKENKLNALSVSGIGENLPFKEQSFGLVYCRQVLHHATNLQNMASEINRVLVPGGIFIATREHVVDNPESLWLFLENHALHKYTQAEGAFSVEEYLKALKRSNMRVLRVLLSWDSVINHYPVSNADIKLRARNLSKKKFGRIGKAIPLIPWVVNYCRHQLSMNDKTPGRMISIIAIKDRK